LNHIGVEVASTDEVAAESDRLAAAGLDTRIEAGTTCCYAVQDKVWVSGPDALPWEIYTVLADAHAELEGRTDVSAVTDAAPAASGCCGGADGASGTPCCG
jgi:hypothetical protein